MKIVLTLALLFAFTLTRAQVYVDGVDINDPANNITIIKVSPFLAKWVIEYRDLLKNRQKEMQEIKDASGRAMLFVSFLDVFNFLEANGWRYLEYVKSESGVMGGDVFLFRRKLPG